MGATAVHAMNIDCDELDDPVSSSLAAKIITSNAVASTCETPGCNPGFSLSGRVLNAVLSRAQSVPAIPTAGGTATMSLNADSFE